MSRNIGDKVIWLQPTIDLNTGEWGSQEVEAEIAELSADGKRYRVITPDDPEPSILYFGEDCFVVRN